MSDIKPIKELELYLVRHGQSLMNIGNGYGVPAGQLTLEQREDPPLSSQGLIQARLLGKKLEDVEFDAVLSSPLVRAAQTALEVVRHSRVERKKILLQPLLTECGVAVEYAGMSAAQLNERFGNYFVPPPGADANEPLVMGNSGDEKAQRTRAQDMLSFINGSFRNGKRVLAVGHGEFNTELLLEILGFGTGRGFDPYFANTGVTKLVFYKKGTGPFGYDIRLCCVNSTAHLEKNGREAYS